MCKLDKLINELCPNGVKYTLLEKVAKISNGRDHKHLEDGEIPVYGSGGIMRYANQHIYNKVSVLIPRKGSIGNIFYVDTPFWTVDTIFYTKINFDLINARFLYHFLLTQNIEQLNTAGGVPSLTKAVLDKIQIPLPPLPVQEEIVRILDKFTELTAELTAELTVRKKQYEYYKNELFSKAENAQITTLDMIAKNCDSQRKPVTSGIRETGDIPYYGASGIVDYVKDYIFDGDYLLISEDGANLLARNTPIAFSVSGKTWVNNHAHVLQFDEYATRRYVEMYLNSIDLSPYITGAAQPKLNQKNLNNIKIPLPPLHEQQRIVDILDRFDTLCNDISSGLPAEIKARQQQYEYYRDKLLTFPKAEIEV